MWGKGLSTCSETSLDAQLHKHNHVIYLLEHSRALLIGQFDHCVQVFVKTEEEKCSAAARIHLKSGWRGRIAPCPRWALDLLALHVGAGTVSVCVDTSVGLAEDRARGVGCVFFDGCG